MIWVVLAAWIRLLVWSCTPTLTRRCSLLPFAVPRPCVGPMTPLVRWYALSTLIAPSLRMLGRRCWLLMRVPAFAQYASTVCRMRRSLVPSRLSLPLLLRMLRRGFRSARNPWNLRASLWCRSRRVCSRMTVMIRVFCRFLQMVPARP